MTKRAGFNAVTKCLGNGGASAQIMAAINSLHSGVEVKPLEPWPILIYKLG